jgi:hypothetical protein
VRPESDRRANERQRKSAGALGENLSTFGVSLSHRERLGEPPGPVGRRAARSKPSRAEGRTSDKRQAQAAFEERLERRAVELFAPKKSRTCWVESGRGPWFVTAHWTVALLSRGARYDATLT